MHKLTDAGTIVKSIIVEGAAGDDNILDLATESELSITLPVKDDDGLMANSIETRMDLPNLIKAPVRKSDVLGSVEYISDGNVIAAVNLIATRNVAKAPVAAVLDPEPEGVGSEQNYSYILLGVLLTASGFVILRTILKKISRRLKKKRYEYKYYR